MTKRRLFRSSERLFARRPPEGREEPHGLLEELPGLAVLEYPAVAHDEHAVVRDDVGEAVRHRDQGRGRQRR